MHKTFGRLVSRLTFYVLKILPELIYRGWLLHRSDRVSKSVSLYNICSSIGGIEAEMLAVWLQVGLLACK